MIALLASIGFGGSLGVIIGILENPMAGVALKIAKNALLTISRGEHLSKDEKDFIRDYNEIEVVAYGHDFSEQLKIANLMRNR